MDTTVIAIVVIVIVAAILVIGSIAMDRSRKAALAKMNGPSKKEREAKAKADARLAAEREAEKQAREQASEGERAGAAREHHAAASGESAGEAGESAGEAGESGEGEPAGHEVQAEAESEEAGESAESAESEVARDLAANEPTIVEDVEITDLGEGVEEESVTELFVDKPQTRHSRIERLRARLAKSSNPFGRAMFNILSKDRLTEADWEEVEDTLLLADVGAEASEELVDELRTDARVTGTSDPDEVRKALRAALLKQVGTDMDRRLNVNKEGAAQPGVIIMVGVNGTGKTTTAGKLARLLVAEDKSVLLGAADTFRAAAADQLETWGAKVGVPVVRSEKDGVDPASVAFEATAKAKADNVDVLLIDTAGRLQNKANLMDELGKIRRVAEKNLPVEEVLLVLDATTGQNGMIQAKVFAEAIGITGVVLTKLDGSAKGGIVISVQKELGVPVKLVGVGEGPDDLAPFDPEAFVDGILD